MRIYLFTVLALAISTAHAQVTFTTLSTPTQQTLTGISFEKNETGYACGNAGTLLKTVNGGLNWSLLAGGTGEDLWDIKIVPGTHAQYVMATGNNNTIVKSTDGGQTWKSQIIPFQPGSFVFGIQCIDSFHYFACGGDYGSFSGAILKTSDGGVTWEKAAVGGSVFLDKVFMTGANNGFCVGTNTSFSDGSIQKIAGSGAWAPVKTTSKLITNLFCINDSTIVAVGLGGQVWRSANSGTSWSNHGIDTTDLYGIAFSNNMNGYACGGSATGNTILVTHDGGVSWTTLPYVFNGRFQSMSMAGDNLFIAGDQGLIIKASLPGTGLPTATPAEPEPEVYPNPSTGNIFINCYLHTLKPGKYTITNILGDVVAKGPVEGVITEVSLHSQTPGIYFYYIEHAGAVIKQGKIVKR